MHHHNIIARQNTLLNNITQQHNTVTHSSLQHNATKHNTKHVTAQKSSAQHNTIQHRCQKERDLAVKGDGKADGREYGQRRGVEMMLGNVALETVTVMCGGTEEQKQSMEREVTNSKLHCIKVYHYEGSTARLQTPILYTIVR